MALLAAAASVALAAERLSAAPRALSASVVGVEAYGDVGSFLSPVAADLGVQRAEVRLTRDPFDQGPRAEELVVAPAGSAPTVNASRPARQLTAILIADDTPVAVIDGEVVNLGDTLPDGARVASIREDRVSLVDRRGRWTVLTLTTRRQ